jgi:hypothetical protein
MFSAVCPSPPAPRGKSSLNTKFSAVCSTPFVGGWGAGSWCCRSLVLVVGFAFLSRPLLLGLLLPLLLLPLPPLLLLLRRRERRCVRQPLLIRNAEQQPQQWGRELFYIQYVVSCILRIHLPFVSIIIADENDVNRNICSYTPKVRPPTHRAS